MSTPGMNEVPPFMIFSDVRFISVQSPDFGMEERGRLGVEGVGEGGRGAEGADGRRS